MAEVSIEHLIEHYAAELGRLSSELIKQRAVFLAEIEELKTKLVDQNSQKSNGNTADISKESAK